jgi:hypothetical protein
MLKVLFYSIEIEMVNTKKKKSKGGVIPHSPQSPTTATRSPRALQNSPRATTSRRSNSPQSPARTLGNTKTPEKRKKIRNPSPWAVQKQNKLRHKNITKTLIL